MGRRTTSVAPSLPSQTVSGAEPSAAAPPNPTCGIGASSVNVRRTAFCTALKTAPLSRKRTSALVGCTLTSTSSGGNFDENHRGRDSVPRAASCDTPGSRCKRWMYLETNAG